jgi:hypothetical protein
MTRQKHSVSDPRQMNRRNPLEVNVNKKKQFEAVDPFASNNPYSKVISGQINRKEIDPTNIPTSIGPSKLRQKMGLSGQMFDFYGDQLKQSGVIKVKPVKCNVTCNY